MYLKILREKRVLSIEEITKLAELGKNIHEHYNFPQDTEWAIEDGKIFMLQSRPVTTLNMNNGEGETEEEADERIIITKGLGASPGMASGCC